jgi:alkylhydroperoxidase family enzyme
VAIVSDHHDAGLDPVDVAVMGLADKVAQDATSVTQADIDALRAHGLSDAEIFDVIAAAAARCFFSKVLDGVGAQADARYAELEGPLRETLTVGRSIADR